MKTDLKWSVPDISAMRRIRGGHGGALREAYERANVAKTPINPK